MSIHELMQVVECPQRPVETGDDAKWNLLEKKLGMSLPRDWRDFGLYYGTGRLRDADRLFVNVINPFASNVFEELTEYCELFRQAKSMIGTHVVPYGIFPENPGLFPWGEDANGGHLCWLTLGQPEKWPVLVNPPRDDYFEQFDMSMTSFLAKSFRREIACVLWRDPPDFFLGPEPVVFEPGKKGNYP